eukprot:23425-Eustigmatos_ZCMA.PRE.1
MPGCHPDQLLHSCGCHIAAPHVQSSHQWTQQSAPHERTQCPPALMTRPSHIRMHPQVIQRAR